MEAAWCVCERPAMTPDGCLKCGRSERRVGVLPLMCE